MFRKMILCTLAGAALIPAAALAQHGGGGGGGHGGGMGNPGFGAGMGGPGMGGGMGGGFDRPGGMGEIGIPTRDQTRIHSQGSANASAFGTGHASQNSVLSGTSTTRVVTRGPLTGLTNGMTLFSNGIAVGTVQQIRTSGRGSAVAVIFRSTSGGLFAIPAHKLVLSGGMLSTRTRFASTRTRAGSQGLMHASITGITHANSRSALGRGAVASSALPGLTTGLSVRTSGGRTLGTVSQVVRGPNGAVRLVLVTSPSGGTIRLVPWALSISGGVVTTTQVS